MENCFLPSLHWYYAHVFKLANSSTGKETAWLYKMKQFARGYWDFFLAESGEQ